MAKPGKWRSRSMPAAPSRASTRREAGDERRADRAMSAAGHGRLEAQGHRRGTHLSVSSKGLTESDILYSLDGRGSVRRATGRSPVMVSAGVARRLQSRARAARALADSSRTDLTALSGTFTFRNGVAQTGDLSAGSIWRPSRWIFIRRFLARKPCRWRQGGAGPCGRRTWRDRLASFERERHRETVQGSHRSVAPPTVPAAS